MMNRVAIRRCCLLMLWLGCAPLASSPGGENVLRPRTAPTRSPTRVSPQHSQRNLRLAAYDEYEDAVEIEPGFSSPQGNPRLHSVIVPPGGNGSNMDEWNATSSVGDEPDMWREADACPPTPLELLWWQRFQRAFAGYREPNDPERHFGFGEPLIGTSWRNRPWYIGGFLGGIIGDDLQSGTVDQGGGFFGGGRFGYDFSHYSAAEVNLAFANLDIDFAGATSAAQSRDSFFDLNLLYYPLGDTRWRPYFTVGLGVASFQFDGPSGDRTRGSAVSIPFGGGLKYLAGRNLALRFDLTDHFTLDSGNEIDAMHNLTFTGGLEIHFGGKYTNYGPW